MSNLNPPLLSPDRNPVSIGTVPWRCRREALSFLLTGRQDGEHNQLDHFLSFTQQESLGEQHLWWARDDDQTLAVTLVVPCAGRTGMMFLSPLRDESRLPTASQLVEKAARAQPSASMRILQALLEPHQGNEIAAYQQAGFTRLAQLVYMERSAPREPRQLDLGPEYEVLSYKSRYRGLFADAILASYEATHDCPGLLGLRDIDDILDGHLATGEFRPRLWHCIRAGDEPVGVMLLNVVAQQRALELVYLGLAPGHRNRGLGRRLMEYGLSLCRVHGTRSMVLAVDDSNAQAVSLYRALAFRSTGRKVALIRALP